MVQLHKLRHDLCNRHCLGRDVPNPECTKRCLLGSLLTGTYAFEAGAIFGTLHIVLHGS